jgi:NAD(P)H-hydrate epimerase
MSEPVSTRAQSREIDRRAIDEYGFTGLVLMENAGRGCVDVLERVGLNVHDSVVILCGKGNNAGDGFVIARHLAIRGYRSRVLLLCPPAELRGDAATNFAILAKCDVPIIDVAGLLTEPAGRFEISLTFDREGAGSGDPRTTVDLSSALAGPASAPTELVQQLNRHGQDATWLIDAMLGTGAHGEPRAPFDSAIAWLNNQRPQARVLAVDVPSGLDCDTGQTPAHTVRADHTCTFAAMKAGFAAAPAKPYVGTVHVCDIGVPPRLIDEVARL